MSEHIQTRPTDDWLPDVILRFPPLPTWLAHRLLAAGERVTCVYGPRFNPSWERLVTHPALVLVSLALGAVCVGIGALVAQTNPQALGLGFVAAVGLFVGTVFLLAVCCGYFTRLVVTDFRLFVVQGYELCKSWDLNALPRSLLRFTLADDGEERPSIDLDAVRTMLGPSSNQVADSKTILSFGKQLDHIRTCEKKRP